MRRSRPLTEAHPELLVIEIPGLSREYRVENRQLSRLSGLPWVSRLDVFSVILVGLLWPSVRFFQDLPHLSVTHNACQVKGNAALMIATGIGLGLLIYRKVTQVLWGASHSEPTPVIRTDVTSRVCPCSSPLRHSARNTSRAPLSAILCVQEVYTFDRSARCANQRRIEEMGRAVLPCSPLLFSSRRAVP